jgi:hypothetical protein
MEADRDRVLHAESGQVAEKSAARFERAFPKFDLARGVHRAPLRAACRNGNLNLAFCVDEWAGRQLCLIFFLT